MVEAWSRYQHVERLGTPDVEGLLDGNVYVFPKLDGSNVSIYWDDKLGKVMAASRNKVMNPDTDEMGVYAYLNHARGYGFASDNNHIIRMAEAYPDYIFYGEWLRKHVIKDYIPDAYNKFYLFDVWDTKNLRYLTYHEYVEIAMKYDVMFIPALSLFNHPHMEDVTNLTEKNYYLMNTPGRVGEGIVIKRYDFVNKFGRTTWGKVVRSEFKDKWRNPDKSDRPIEEALLEDTLTYEFVAKEYAKLVVDEGKEWTDKMIPEFIKSVYAEWWKDCSFDTLNKVGNDSINMKSLRKSASAYIVKYLKYIQAPQ